MSKFLVLGDEACNLSTKTSTTQDVIRLNTIGDHTNIRCEFNVYRSDFRSTIPERWEDLFRIASFIYGADTRISRGTIKDVYNKNWQRSIKMTLPVWDQAFWNSDVKTELKSIIDFITGDNFSFEFVQRTIKEPFQLPLDFGELVDPLPKCDTVVLFSGGIDSLAAAIEAVLDGKHPILVSHRSSPIVHSRQKDLVDALKNSFTNWIFPHISVFVNRQGGSRSMENTQRSRSFLFTSLGAIAAGVLEINDIRLCDNGIVSVNLPYSGENIGTLLTRSTHPKFIEMVTPFLNKVFEKKSIELSNTLFFKTKPEVMNIISESGHPELIQDAISCAHLEGNTKHQPHCGVCSQCIDRRFASLAAGLEEHDLQSRYKKNIFIKPV